MKQKLFIIQILLFLTGIFFLSPSQLLAQRDPLVISPGLKSRPHYPVEGSIEINRDPYYQKMSVSMLIREVFVKSGVCSSVENITAKIYGWDDKNQRWAVPNQVLNRGLAYFHKAKSKFPMKEGLLMTTGSTSEAEGPNEADHAATLDLGSPFMGDDDLAGLVPGYKVQNVAVLEFDFVPAASSMQFEYIFASEEYPKYVNAIFNDVFGFFVTDKTNSKPLGNIAILPDGSAVSINNVNNGNWTDYEYKTRPTNKDTTSHHPQYFVPNPHNTLTTEFNGYTQVLTASITGLTPCNTYHLKLAVGNVGDDAVGSGVFLKANSFVLGNSMSLIVDGKEAFGISRNCNNNHIHITRPALESTEKQTLNLIYDGPMKNGVHYTDLNGNPLPTSVTFLPGEEHIDIWVKATNDAVTGSYFNVLMLCPCGAQAQTAFTIHIHEPCIFYLPVNPKSYFSN
ncbi:MAG: choice-of-anchor L domain-containing protein [Candidatus Symbiothrix sp.]|jgi:hypothetical protein|nr:choice-of-anchor L domain-containing protein [Candidatus Symbiothrix sp.]